MTYLFDTREKKNAHIKAYFDSHNIPYEPAALKVGDYQIKGKPEVSVDRKQDLGELCQNLTSPKDKGRFWREVRRAQDQGIKLIVLCEHGGQVRSISDVAKWKNKYGSVSGRQLMDKIYQVHISYGVDFLFCDKLQTAKTIIRILRNGGVFPIKRIDIYCDGAALNNGTDHAIAAYGIVMLLVEDDTIKATKVHSGLCDPIKSTNNYAEVTAALKALHKVKDPSIPVRVHSDSNYLIETINSGWNINANQLLWQQLKHEIARFDDISFVKVKGHGTCQHNNLADQLANTEAQKYAEQNP